MGLDNGIVVKNLHKNTLPSYVSLAIAPHSDTQLDFAYWRKCWGIRNEILGLLHAGADNYEVKLDKEDIPAVLKVIKKFLNPKVWEEDADSIWEWEQYFDWSVQMYINLKYLYDIWDDHPDIQVFFYDSY